MPEETAEEFRAGVDKHVKKIRETVEMLKVANGFPEELAQRAAWEMAVAEAHHRIDRLIDAVNDIAAHIGLEETRH